jgi:hypothetical protein
MKRGNDFEEIALMLWKRIVVRDQERILIAKNGQFRAILTPGTHRVFTAPGVSVKLEKFDIRDLVFRSTWIDYLVNKRRDVVEQHFIVVETNDEQVAMVYANGMLFDVLTPAKRVLFWRGVATLTAEVVNVIAGPTTESDDLTGSFENLFADLIEV